MESPRRSLVKALTWRATAVCITTWTAWFLTGMLSVAAMIGAVDTAIKLVAYYGHERAWNRIDYGRAPEAEGTSEQQQTFNHAARSTGSVRYAPHGIR